MIDYDSIRNLPAMFFARAARRGDETCLAVKPGDVWETLSWRSVAGQVSALSRGLRDLGIVPGDRVVIVAENRPEWALADRAIAAGAKMNRDLTSPGGPILLFLNDLDGYEFEIYQPPPQ